MEVSRCFNENVAVVFTHLDIGIGQVWVSGPKPVRRKSRNPEIFPQKAENRKAKNAIRLKKYSPIFALLLHLIVQNVRTRVNFVKV